MGILLVFDVTSESSFANINQWMLAIRQHASGSVSKVLLGNKADTSGTLVSKRSVATARGQALADREAWTLSNDLKTLTGIPRRLARCLCYLVLQR